VLRFRLPPSFPEERTVEVRISARHEDFDDEVKDYARRKVEGLSRYYKGTRSIEVLLDGDALAKSVELKAHLAKGAPVIVTASHPDANAAVDIAHGKLERMLHRLKEKLEDRRHGKGHVHPAVDDPGTDTNDISGNVPDLYA
jgi:ribosomal subunit interface protein